jgi:hypothetical protein
MLWAWPACDITTIVLKPLCAAAWPPCCASQAWLGSLLAPGTPIPDRAKAHISLGGHQVQATWWEEGSTWIVSEVEREQAAVAPAQLSLLYADRPVARLVPRRPAAAMSGDTTPRLHRISVLLNKTQLSAASVVFVGSDTSSAPPEQRGGSNGDAPVTVQCVARGCWGTCLPVAVAGVEETDGGQEEEQEQEDGCLIALTVSVQ